MFSFLFQSIKAQSTRYREEVVFVVLPSFHPCDLFRARANMSTNLVNFGGNIALFSFPFIPGERVLHAAAHLIPFPSSWTVSRISSSSRGRGLDLFRSCCARPGQKSVTSAPPSLLSFCHPSRMSREVDFSSAVDSSKLKFILKGINPRK